MNLLSQLTNPITKNNLLNRLKAPQPSSVPPVATTAAPILNEESQIVVALQSQSTSTPALTAPPSTPTPTQILESSKSTSPMLQIQETIEEPKQIIIEAFKNNEEQMDVVVAVIETSNDSQKKTEDNNNTEKEEETIAVNNNENNNKTDELNKSIDSTFNIINTQNTTVTDNVAEAALPSTITEMLMTIE